MFKCKIRKQGSVKNVKIYAHRAGQKGKGAGIRKLQFHQKRECIHLDWYWIGDRNLLNELFYS